MSPTVISPNIQEFNGLRYWRDGKYFKPREGHERLHRAVWSNFWGPIPEGMLIHHIDDDTTNNRLENLLCLSRVEHMRHHREDLYRRRVQIICVVCGNPALVAATRGTRAKCCSKPCGDRLCYLNRKQLAKQLERV